MPRLIPAVATVSVNVPIREDPLNLIYTPRPDLYCNWLVLFVLQFIQKVTRMRYSIPTANRRNCELAMAAIILTAALHAIINVKAY